MGCRFLGGFGILKSDGCTTLPLVCPGNILLWGRISLNGPVGLPSAVICMWGNTLANAALFALIFPSVSL